MKRRDLIVLFGGATAWPLVARAQPEKMRRIGVLMVWPAGDPEAQAQIAAFRDGLRSLGWAEGRNIILDIRWSSAEVAVIQRFAKSLTDLQPDVFLATGTPAVNAIVFTQVTDPVAQGLVESLDRPGGSMTGLSIFEPDIGGKWLQVLKEVAPASRRAAVIFNPDTAPYYPLYMRSIEAAAATLDVKVFEAAVHNHADIEAALQALAGERGSGVIVMSDLFAFVHRDLIVDLTARYRVPAVYPLSSFVTEGGLISYGVQLTEMQRRAATFVDRILHGAKPGDLPVELSTRFVLAINQSTARTLGFDIALTLLTRADEVIE
jgi:putative tryptophan/tyrosine transport system substrate-binding protein